jgi:hypothetical protein
LVRANAGIVLLCLLTVALPFAGCDSSGPPEVPAPAETGSPPREPDLTTGAELLERLGAIGYVDGTSEPEAENGVLQVSKEAMAPGLTLYLPGGTPQAFLVDARGNLRHHWKAPFSRAFPTNPDRSDKLRKIGHWRHAEVQSDGSLVVLWHLHGFFKLDRRSNLVWSVPMFAHHDFHQMPDGSFYVMTLGAEPLEGFEGSLYRTDSIDHVDANGNQLGRVSLADAMENVGWRELRDEFWRREGTRETHLRSAARQDPFHSNSIYILSGAEARRLGPPFAAGQALVSVLMLDSIVAIDLARGETAWIQTGPFALQHHARVTRSGRISLFNNFVAPGESSVQIIDPRTSDVVWEYAGPDGNPVFSSTSSSAEVLPNGNLLIVSTNQGRILEVTPQKEVVWEYRTPETVSTGHRANIYYAERVRPRKLAWLVKGAPQRPPE